MSYFKKVHPFLQLLIFIGMAFGIFILVGTAGTLLLTVISGKSLSYIADPGEWDLADPQALMIARSLLVIQFLSLFIIPVFLFARLSDSKPFDYLGLRSTKTLYFVLGVAALILALPFVGWAGEINNQLIPENTNIGKWMKSMEEAAAQQMSFMLKKEKLSDLFLNLLFVAVFAGIGEELFFRGVLQRLLIKLFKNAWAGIIVAAFIFSAFHLQFYGFIPRFILGVLLGFIYWYSGSLWPAIIAHFAYNAFAVIVIYFNPAMADQSATPSFGNETVMAIVSLVLVIAVMIIMKRKSTTTHEMMYARDKIDDSNPFA
jgi:hypothetical protein